MHGQRRHGQPDGIAYLITCLVWPKAAKNHKGSVFSKEKTTFAHFGRLQLTAS